MATPKITPALLQRRIKHAENMITQHKAIGDRITGETPGRNSIIEHYEQDIAIAHLALDRLNFIKRPKINQDQLNRLLQQFPEGGPHGETIRLLADYWLGTEVGECMTYMGMPLVGEDGTLLDPAELRPGKEYVMTPTPFGTVLASIRVTASEHVEPGQVVFLNRRHDGSLEAHVIGGYNELDPGADNHSAQPASRDADRCVPDARASIGEAEGPRTGDDTSPGEGHR